MPRLTLLLFRRGTGLLIIVILPNRLGKGLLHGLTGLNLGPSGVKVLVGGSGQSESSLLLENGLGHFTEYLRDRHLYGELFIGLELQLALLKV